MGALQSRKRSKPRKSASFGQASLRAPKASTELARTRRLSLPCPVATASHGVSLCQLRRQKAVDSPTQFERVVSRFRSHHTLFDAVKIIDSQHAGALLPPSTNHRANDAPLDDYVRLPCHYQPRRWQEIVKRLQCLCSADATSFDVEEAILYCADLQSCDSPLLDVLHHLINNANSKEERERFVQHTLPGMVNLAVRIPYLIPTRIPLLRRNEALKLSLTQQQIASLMANAFFCTFPDQDERRGSKFPSINFIGLFMSGSGERPCPRKLEKLRGILNYMDRVICKPPLGVVTISRRHLNHKVDWSCRTELMPELLHVSDAGTIEDTGGGFLEADFANKLVGGGALGRGFVQEEIRFFLCPELIVTRLVTECLGDWEALHVKGFERFNDYTGYADSCKWERDHQDSRPVGIDRRRLSHLVAMDALKFTNWREQFTRENIERELNKALVAFGGEAVKRTGQHQREAVATGNWGCGAFKGDVRLKFLIQLMACSLSGRDVAYFTFGDRNLQQRLLGMHQFLRRNDVCIGGVHAALMAFVGQLESSDLRDVFLDASSANLFDFVRQFVLCEPTILLPPEQRTEPRGRGMAVGTQRARHQSSVGSRNAPYLSSAAYMEADKEDAKTKKKSQEKERKQREDEMMKRQKNEGKLSEQRRSIQYGVKNGTQYHSSNGQRHRGASEASNRTGNPSQLHYPNVRSGTSVANGPVDSTARRSKGREKRSNLSNGSRTDLPPRK